ncbi:hypothetical protein PS15p_209352 [Mucor circinelloides]
MKPTFISLFLLLLATVSYVLADVIIDCQGPLQRCPAGYTQFFAGRNMLNSTCHCRRPNTPEEQDANKKQLCNNHIAACYQFDSKYEYDDTRSDQCFKAFNNCEKKVVQKMCDRLAAEKKKFQCP